MYSSLTKAESTYTTISSTFKSNEDATRNHQTSLPIKAAQLGALLNSLTEVENAVSGSIQARKALLAGLEKLITETKEGLEKAEENAASLSSKRAAMVSEKDNIEQMILRGTEPEPDRPEAEALTPPEIETITPVGSPKAEHVKEEAEELKPSVLAFKHETSPNGADQPSAKKRKLSQIESKPVLDFGGIDPEVAALLGGN